MPKSLTKILATLLLVVAINPTYAGYPNCSGSIATANDCGEIWYSLTSGVAGYGTDCTTYYEYNSVGGKSYACGRNTAAEKALTNNKISLTCLRNSGGGRCNPVMCPSKKANQGCSAVSAADCTGYYAENISGYPPYVNLKCEVNGTACQNSTTGCNPP
jgi:hypothetical protein